MGCGRAQPASQRPIVFRIFSHGNLRLLQCLHNHDLLHILPILTADDITCIVNERVNAGLAVATSAVPIWAPPHSFKLKMFSVTSKECLDYNHSLTYTMEIPPFAPGTANLKTSAANAVQSSQLRTAINTAISVDAAAHFDSHDELFGEGF